MAMTLRLTEEETNALRATAEREHRSMQEVAREAIRIYVLKSTEERDRIIDEIVTEDAHLLDRLGSA